MKTPISYYGGKQTMLKHILPLIPQHKLYTEAFCGGCAVLFAKEPSDCEVINDLNKTLVNFYRVSKLRFADLKLAIQATLHSRDEHNHSRYVMANPLRFDQVEQAWAVWVASKQSYASMLDATFGYDRNGTTAKKIDNARLYFDDNNLADRLNRVTIECEDGIKLIQRYDTADAFHFVDPPYINSDCGHYAGSFSDDDFANLLKVLSEIKGKFMLTMFPHDDIIDYAFRNHWIIHKVERTISVSKNNRRKQEEWIVCNYII